MLAVRFVVYSDGMLVTAVIFIALLAVLILVHEAGHYVVARKAGMRVEEFGFGFPPRIFGFRRKHTDATATRPGWELVGRTTVSEDDRTIYSLNWIPLGGFVKIFGEEGEGRDDTKSFASRSPGVRAAVIVAGVVMNMLLAMTLFSAGHMVGLPSILEDTEDAAKYRNVQIQVLEVAEKSPAGEAGLMVGDAIRSIGGIPMESVDEVQEYVQSHKGVWLSVEVLHDGKNKVLTMMPRVNPPDGQGPLGFAMARTGMERLPWYKAIPAGIADAFVLAWTFLQALAVVIGRLFAGQGAGGDITGPVGIAVLTGRVVKMGFVHLLQFAGAISVNLALINIFPIPALDGGRLLFIILEKLKGRPVSRSAEQRIHQMGFIILLMLMLFITARDIARLF